MYWEYSLVSRKCELCVSTYKTLSFSDLTTYLYLFPLYPLPPPLKTSRRIKLRPRSKIPVSPIS